MASRVYIYLLPVILLVLVLFLSEQVKGQSARRTTFLFERNNQQERRRNNQRRTEEEKERRRQQRLKKQRNQQNAGHQSTNARTPVVRNPPVVVRPPSQVNPTHAQRERTVNPTQQRNEKPQTQTHNQQQPSQGETQSSSSDPRITVAYVWERLQALEQRVSTAMRHLTQHQAKITEIENRASAPSQPQPQNTGALVNTGSLVKKFAEEPACPNGVEGYYYAPEFKSCYHLAAYDVYVNWTEGVELCRRTNRQAHLVAIETEAEQNYLKSKWQVERGIATISRFWTSGMRKNKRWRWESTRRLVGPYSNWIPTTTHEDDEFNCLAIFSNEAYYWGDVACWHPHLVTCEIKVK